MDETPTPNTSLENEQNQYPMITTPVGGQQVRVSECRVQNDDLMIDDTSCSVDLPTSCNDVTTMV
jgi:hypothetical protein